MHFLRSYNKNTINIESVVIAVFKENWILRKYNKINEIMWRLKYTLETEFTGESNKINCKPRLFPSLHDDVESATVMTRFVNNPKLSIYNRYQQWILWWTPASGCLSWTRSGNWSITLVSKIVNKKRFNLSPKVIN